MKISLINASPKIKNSNSELILNDLKHYLKNIEDLVECKLSFNSNFKKIFDTIADTQTWVFAFPLYADNLPAHLLEFLQWLDENNLCSKSHTVYAICNCGFYEGIQTDCAINVVKLWCDKTGNTYGGGVGIGGGEALSVMKTIPIGCGPKMSIDKALSNMSDAITNNLKMSDKFVNLDYPRFLYKMGATCRWHREIKQNGGKIKDLDKKFY